MGIKKYSDEELINLYKELANELGRTPTNRDVNNKSQTNKDFPSAKTLGGRFKGLTNLAVLCGFSTNKSHYTKEQLLQFLKDYLDKNGIPKSYKNDFIPENNLPAFKTYKDYFGSRIKLIDLIKMTDYQLSEEEIYQLTHRSGCKRSYTKEEIIEKVLAMEKKLNRPLAYDDFRNPTQDSIGITYIRQFFGTMNKMKEELGLEIIQESMIDRIKTNEQMLEELQDYINELGRVPTSRDLDKNPNIAKEATYSRYFGGLNNALIQLGYKPNKEFPAKDYTNEDLIKMYKEYIDEIGFVPSYDFCCSIDSLIYPHTVLRRFKCKWNEFIAMLGFEPNERAISSEITYAKDGSMCLSSAEIYLHNWFLENENIKILDKEGYYKDFLTDKKLQQEAGYKRYDWLLHINNKVYVVEYFGMMDFKNYNDRHDFKLSLINRDNKQENFIPLYYKDLYKVKGIFQEVIDNGEYRKKYAS